MKFDLRVNSALDAEEKHDDSIGRGACRCGARWFGLSICHCATCHLTFTTVTGFDVHRFRNRCRTQTELRAKGYEPNDDGHWREPLPAGQEPWHPAGGNS